MRAIQLSQGELSYCSDLPAPAVPDGSVRVRVLQAGICETDLQLVAGYMGFSGILGHEFVGVAESGALQGERVVGEINCVCRECDLCLAGLTTHCRHRTVIGIFNHDGAFADYLVVPEVNLHRVPDELSNDMATLVEPAAAALQIPEQIPLTPATRAIVVGDGRLGNLCAQVLAAAKCQLLVVGKHGEKLESIRSLGFDTRLLRDAPTDRTADIVVECSGSHSGLETALQLVRPRGTVVMKTTIAAAHCVPLAPIVIDEITVVGSRCGPFDKALEAMVAGQFQLDRFISGRYRLEQFQEAFQRAQERDALKVILEVATVDDRSADR